MREAPRTMSDDQSVAVARHPGGRPRDAKTPYSGRDAHPAL